MSVDPRSGPPVDPAVPRIDPQVSVCLPLYRPSPQYLAETVRSVRAQTRLPIEVLFSDDTESPARDLVDELAQGLPYRYIHNARRLGMVHNWNAAIRASTGTHVLLLHQDDALAPRALEIMASAFSGRRELAICGVGETRVDEHSRPRPGRPRPNHRSRVFVSPGVYQPDYDELVYLMLRNGQVFGTPSAMMFSRTHFDRVGGFDPLLRQSVDIDFALRMAQLGGATYLTEELVRFRRHATQATQGNIALGHNLTDRANLYERHLDPERFTPEQIDRVRASLTVRAIYDALRAARNQRWRVMGRAVRQAGEFRSSPQALGERLVELARWENHDAR